ncbi:hypothetical protein BDQ17DRAFT_1333861 [Cyathus striatus]|nr:hypothetical protein BDQ17DRAFT_1333861 [Cyathus striatus]
MGLFNRKSSTSKAKDVVREARKPMREGLELVDVYSGMVKYEKAMGLIAQYMALEETCDTVVSDKPPRDLKVQLLRLAADAETYRLNVFKTLSESLSESDGKIILDIGLAKRKVPPRVFTAEKALEEAEKGLAKVHANKDIFYVMDFSTLLIEYNMLMTRCNEVITGRPTVLNADTLVKEAYKYQKDVDTAVAQAKERVAKVPMDKDPKLAGDSKYIPYDPKTPDEWQETSDSLVSKAAEIANKGRALLERFTQLLGQQLTAELLERYTGLATRAQNITEKKEEATEGGKRLVGDCVCFVAAVQKAVAEKNQELLEKQGKIKKPVIPDIEPSTGVLELDYALYVLIRAQAELEKEELEKFRVRIDAAKEKKDATEVKQLLIDAVLAVSVAVRAKITGTTPPKANGNGHGHVEPASEPAAASSSLDGIEEVPKDDKGKGKEGAAAPAPAATSTSKKRTPDVPVRAPLVTAKDREDAAALLYCDALVVLNQFKKGLSNEDIEKLDKQAAGLEKKIPKSIDDKTFAKEARVFKDIVLVAIDTTRKEALQKSIDAEIKRQASKIPVFQVHLPEQRQAPPPQASPLAAPSLAPEPTPAVSATA